MFPVPRFHRRWRLPPKRVYLWQVAASVPLGVIVVVGAVLSYHYHGILQRTHGSLDHTYQVLIGVEDVLGALRDAETGQRGYIITGDRSYLEPYEAALQNAPRSITRLRGLVTGNSVQTASMAELDRLISERLVVLARTVKQRETEGFEATRLALVEGTGKRLMDQIRARVSEIREAERTSLEDRRADAEAQEREITLLGVWVTVASLLTRGAITLVFGRLRRRNPA